MRLTHNGLKEKDFWLNAGVALPSYSPVLVSERTAAAPAWIHFGIGNIFRIFVGSIADRLLEEGLMDRGIICAETFDTEVVDKIYRPFDNLALNVTLHSDGRTDRKVIGVFTEALKAVPEEKEQWLRLKQVFRNPSLQVVTMTITEKGYALRDENGKFYPFVEKELEGGPEKAHSAPAVFAAMLKERFENGAVPLALVSLDNCSRNGKVLREAVLCIAEEWKKRNHVSDAFLEYLKDEKKVSFPWTMIDKITPRPSEEIAADLENRGIENMRPVITEKKTFIAPFANAEGPQYLVVEDCFPNGRPPFEKAGVYMADRDTVNKAERMKVTVCLNPVHTALCTYDCMLGYEYFADGMQDEDLLALAQRLAYHEGMKVVDDPGILSPYLFLNELFAERFPNKYLGDTSQRIAVDISQMTAIRFGETIKSYVERYGSAEGLTAVPLAIAGWLRYLLGTDDHGEPFETAPDPRGEEIRSYIRSCFRLGEPGERDRLRPVLSNSNLFGMNLYEAGIGKTVEDMFLAMLKGKGAVRDTLRKYLWEDKTMEIKNHVTGVQHLGLPTGNFAETLAFYEGLGFEIAWKADGRDCAFLRMGNVMIETYGAREPHPVWGAWDHIALNVNDVDAVYEEIRSAGYTFAEGEDGPRLLPFFENGVRYFTIIGPNNEKIEFNQIL